MCEKLSDESVYAIMETCNKIQQVMKQGKHDIWAIFRLHDPHNFGHVSGKKLHF